MKSQAILRLLFWSFVFLSGFQIQAEVIRVEAKGLSAPVDTSLPVNVTVQYTENSADISRLFNEGFRPKGHQAQHILVTYDDGFTEFPRLESPTAPDTVIELKINNRTTVKLEAKKTALLMATIQTSISSFTFFNFSNGPIEGAAMASLMSLAMSMYYSLDPNRWMDVLAWGERKATSHLKKAEDRLEQLGLQVLPRINQERVRDAAHFAVGTGMTIGFSYMFGAALAWDNVLEHFGQWDNHQQTIFNGVLASFATGIWDSTLLRWKNIEKSKEVLGRLDNVWRTKNILGAALMPLVFMGLEPAQGIAFASGTTSILALWNPQKTRSIIRSALNKCSTFLTKNRQTIN